MRIKRRSTSGRYCRGKYVKAEEQIEVFKWSDPYSEPRPLKGRKISRHWISLGVFATEEEALEIVEQEVEFMSLIAT